MSEAEGGDDIRQGLSQTQQSSLDVISQPQDSSRTGGILIGIVTAILGLIIFAPVPNEWKVPSILALLVIGVLNLFYLTGTNRRINSWNERRERDGRIKGHPEFQSELYRLDAMVYRVLFERSSDHASLAMLDERVLRSLNSGEFEFKEKISILQGTYQVIHNRLGDQRWNKRRWKTLEFMDAAGLISIYLNQLDKVLSTVYRAASSRKEGTPIPVDAQIAWEAFRSELNAMLHQWNTFTDRATQVLGYGSQSQLKLAEPLR